MSKTVYGAVTLTLLGLILSFQNCSGGGCGGGAGTTTTSGPVVTSGKFGGLALNR
jgi:hypothetical protein